MALFVTHNLPLTQSPTFSKREFGNECEYQLAGHGDERQAGAYGDEADTEQGGYNILWSNTFFVVL